MSASRVAALSAFVEGAPPGELGEVIADVKALTTDDAGLIRSLGPAFQRYNEEQFTSTKLPGGSQQVLVSSHNALGDGRYYDPESLKSFAFDHIDQTASAPQSYVPESKHTDMVKSLLKAVGVHANEHFPDAAYGVYPTEEDSSIAIVVVSNKYSPQNYWNGRWRSLYILDPSSGSVTGSIKVDVHYYEDGNVRLLTTKPVSTVLSSSPASASEVIRLLASTEKKYQEELNRAFASLSEGAFKGLRRQLPVSRQKIAWEKIATYRLGKDIGGGWSR
ncbi:MAG: F-actin-capping protein subunit alpha [Thelocarpon impressellum]|nr:MAG: F-actin-capping protein subunit alpha [Thelocarpon impressellum]